MKEEGKVKSEIVTGVVKARKPNSLLVRADDGKQEWMSFSKYSTGLDKSQTDLIKAGDAVEMEVVFNKSGIRFINDVCILKPVPASIGQSSGDNGNDNDGGMPAAEGNVSTRLIMEEMKLLRQELSEIRAASRSGKRQFNIHEELAMSAHGQAVELMKAAYESLGNSASKALGEDLKTISERQNTIAALKIRDLADTILESMIRLAEKSREGLSSAKPARSGMGR